MKKIFLTLVFIGLALVQTAYAGLVPGTIQKSGYTSSNTCNNWTSSYSPAGGSCYTGWRKTWDYNGPCHNAYWTTNTCTCDNSSPAVAPTCSGTPLVCSWGSPAVPNTCTCSNSVYVPDTYSCYEVTSWLNLPSTSGTLTFINYTPVNNNNPTFSSDGSNRHLSSDNSQSCNRWANGTNHTPPGTTSFSCIDGSSWYYINGSNGSCDSFWSTDNLINSFNQLGSVSRTSPSDGDATCTVEWRYATADDTGPTASVSATPAVFDGDQNNWCNMSKYLASDYGTNTNPELPGCTYYKNKISHANTSDKHPDLLENLDITVDDVSGISQVVIEIGASCSATYNLATDVASVVASTTAASGVKPSYKNITFKYNTTSTNGGAGAPGQGLPSLLSQFGKSRLDQCLTEGKNFLRVTMKDNARSDADGTSYAPNTSVLDYSGQNKFIKIDNSGSKLGLTGEARKVAESNTPANCFVGGAVLDNKWKNYTISGSILSADPFGADGTDCSQRCTVLTGTGYTCSTSATKWAMPAAPNSTNHFVWTAPGGVNPTTGAFTGYTCDGLGPIPSTASCEWDCSAGYSYDPVTRTCIQSSNLFILFDTGTAEASWPFAAKLSNDPNASHGLLKSKVTSCTTPPNATKSEKPSTFRYQAGASYFFADAPGTPFPIVENGAGLCTPTCWTNYTAASDTTSGSCTAATRTADCSLPQNIAHALWNTSGIFLQTWAGTSTTSGSWTPATSAAVYDTNPGSCHYKCDSNTIWDSATQSCLAYNRWCYTSSDGTQKNFTTAYPWAMHQPWCWHTDGNFYLPWQSTSYLNGTITCVSSTSPIPDSRCSLH